MAIVVLVAVSLSTDLVFSSQGSALDGVEPDGSAVEQARAELAVAREHRVEAESRLAEAEAASASLHAEIERLDAGAAQITEDLADARRDVREYAVAAYIDGGQGALITASLDADESAAMAWRAQVVGGQAVDAADAVDRFSALKESNDPDRLAAAARLDAVNAALGEAEGDAIQAAAHERDAEAELARAIDFAERAAADAEVSAAATVPSNSSSAAQVPSRPVAAQASPAASGSPTASESAALAKIRHCESRGNYSIVSASGTYRGAYQFDQRTWASVGGSGDPAAASPAEQDYRALLLYRQRGRRPWPNCG